MTSDRYPAVVIHGLAHARTVLGIGRAVTLLSAPGAALFAGCGWWRAVIERARGEYPGVPIDDILDCADAPGLALGALRIGQRRLVLSPTSPGWQSVAAIAASLGGEVLSLASTSARYGRPERGAPATRLVAGANRPG